MASGDGERSYWRWSKEDFFPEPSFRSWTAYGEALSHTRLRLRNRLLYRSTDAAELLALPRRSEHELRRCLNWWDLAWLGFGAVVGTGIFVLTGQEARFSAGPAIPLAYAAAGASALLSSLIYAEFASDVPSAGGSFSYLRIELGEFVAYLAAANILLEAIVGAAGLARSWTSYFATLLGRDPDALRIHAPALAAGFDLLDPIAVVVLIACSTVAMFGTRGTSILNWLTSLLSVAVIGFIIAAGFTHADASNLAPFFPMGAKGVLQAAAVVYWAYTGFDMVATMAEETRNPARDIPLGLVGSMSAITIVYCVMALVLVMMQRYDQLDPNAAYAVAFEAVGMRWAKYLVALGALKGMTTGLLVGALGQGRYTTQIARAHMIPPYFALVHPRTGTPVYATILVTLSSAIIALFSSLDVLASVSSISTLFIFALVALALLVRRYYDRESPQQPRAHLAKLTFFLTAIVGSSVAVSTCWNTNPDGWIGFAVTVPLWFLSTLGLALLVPQQRTPKLWRVPLMPWLPSLSIATNVFLMGSLGYEAYVRFGICTAAMLAYYVLVGVHATYDVAQEETSSNGDEIAPGFCRYVLIQ
ncbi:cationic amino acid transporter 5-like [Zingiber officinale]|uniref:Cationic amino acid transporter C-terminal domain-containing protein n=2 Tax=Zingiber officinale TaxID=94328 RepID=A0A8J5KEZ6_ZINOF|nr:cationic amino acid transporter 5-like [Zingiber officinale]KAG6487277.1 hypothetical protein ZIOFF_055862 [Zingiber officinale]